MGRKEEVMEVFNNVTIFASNMKAKLDNNDKKQKGYGYIVLLFALVNDVSGDEVTCWNNDHVNDIIM